ncbi:MAG: ABC transporter ATP-binding protein [Nostoc sp.]|uniref:ABC transporter ATP-binding protein n=1 Tax=Nostoc sp. TaxID=1180 RepID=UPI002FEFF10A
MFKQKTSNSLIFEIARENWQLVLFSLILVFSVSLLESFTALLIAPLMSSLSSVPINESQIPKLFRDSVVYYNELPYEIRLATIALIILILTSLKNLLAYVLGVNFYKVEVKTGENLRNKCIRRLLSLEVNYYNQARMGDILSYLNEHPQRCQTLVNSLIQLFKDILITLFLSILLVSISWHLTVITIFTFSLIAIILKFILRKIRILSREVVHSIENYSTVITEIIQGIKLIKAFNTEVLEEKRSELAFKKRFKAELKAYKYIIIPPPLTETLGTFAILTILLLGATASQKWVAISLPLLLTYTYALLRILPRLVQINNLRSQSSFFVGSLDAIYNFLETTKVQTLPNGNFRYTPSQKDGIVFRNVSFGFVNHLETTLKNIDIIIPKGKTTALVGYSGSGKSTLVNLIMRFYDPTEGYIEVNGKDLRKYIVGSWRQHIGVVEQDTFLFNTSVMNNIAYGNPSATKQKIIEAAKKAYAYEFIQELPENFETILGNRGLKLSGGQRQRIAIARAILRDPDILILDEATSALDSNSERIVQRAIEEVSRDRTVIVIAHRLSTIEKADKIIVMYNGRVAEQGTHEELLALQGEYWSLYKSQVSVKGQIIQST